MEATIQQPRTLSNHEIQSIAHTIRMAIGNSLDQANTKLRHSINSNKTLLLKDHTLYQQMAAKAKEQQALIDAHMADINKASTYIKLLSNSNPFLDKTVSDSWRISTGDRDVSNIFEQIANDIEKHIVEQAYLDQKLVRPYNLESLIEADLVLKNSEGKVVNQDIEKYVEEYTLRFVTAGENGELEIEFDESDEDEDFDSDEDEW